MQDRKDPKIPLRGVSNASTVKGTPDGFAPLDGARNIRAHGVGTDRQRVSRRAGMAKTFANPLKEGAWVQGVGVITRARARSGYRLGNGRALSGGTSVQGGTLTGQIAALDPVPSMDWFKNLDTTQYGAAAGTGAQAIALSPDKTFLVAASNFTSGGDGRFSLARYTLDGALVWQVQNSDAGHSRTVNAICISKLYTWVAIRNTNTSASAPLLLAFRNDTGAQAYGHNLNGWANEAVALALSTTAAGVENLYVAYHGAARAGTYTGGIGSGVITAGRWALQFRSAVRKLQLNSGSYGPTAATHKTFGTQITASDPYFEGAHGDWRLSEHTPYMPHGGEFTALAAGPDGSVFFAKRNQGWGPNISRPEFLPDGQSEPYATVGKITSAGALAWMVDTASILENQDPVYPYYNDLTFPGDPSPDPSINAISVDAAGDVYAAGRRNAIDKSAFKIDGLTGTVVWDANIMPAISSRSVRENGACIDPSDGNPVFVGDRNTSWDGALGKPAHWWKLNRFTGAVVKAYDINHEVSGLSVCAAAGKTYYTLDFVS